MVLQDAYGVFDQRHPLPLTGLNSCSLSEFFASYCLESGISIQSLDGLEFKVVLSGQDAITVHKGEDEQSWRSLKQDITELVALARLKKPEETTYEIRVSPGEQATIRVNEKEHPANRVVSRQKKESLSGLPSVSNILSTDEEAGIMSNTEGKMRASKANGALTSDEATQDTGKSAPILRGHRINEIQAIIRERLLHSSCAVDTRLQDHGLKSKESRTATIEDYQEMDAPSQYDCTFHVQWDINKFWIEQCRTEKLKSLESVIVLTGDGVNAQATTVGEYLRTNWPQSGPMLLVVLQAFLENGRYASKSMSHPRHKPTQI